MKLHVVGLLALCAAVGTASAVSIAAGETTATGVNKQEADRLGHLPGIGKLPFEAHSGYLNVDESNGRNLFYFFARSYNTSSKDLVLWLNGGPGCSSMSGMMTENGPIRANSDGKTLSLFPHSWNTIANMLWIEAPAGVGFSYSDTKSDYNTGDDKTASDNLKALLRFFETYPEAREMNFFVTGESYFGHYGPELVNAIVEHNKAADASSRINLKGFAAGNPLTDERDDFNAPLRFYLAHSMISQEQYDKVFNECGGDFNDPSSRCQNAVATASRRVGRIDAYDIMEDVCLDDNHSPSVNQKFRLASHMPGLKEMAMQPPCLDVYTSKYLNRKDVQKALHVRDHVQWSECTDSINYKFSHDSMIPLYSKFMNSTDLRVVVYSGNMDSVLPTEGTQGWIARLGRDVESEWTAWLGSDGQLGGYEVVYDRMRFVVVHGAGHMVPGEKPIHGLDMLHSLLADKALSN